MASIAIIGPGAIGGVMTAWLERTGRHEVVLCARRPLDELVVALPDEEIRLRPRVFTDPAQAPAVDWALVTTKAYDAPGASRWLESLCRDGGRAAILQNGIEHRERFAHVLPSERIVPVVVDCPAERVEPGRIRQRGTALMTVQDDSAGRALAELFSGTAVKVVLTTDWKSAAWKKLCLNAAGVLSGLVLQPAGVMRDPAMGEAARALVREVIAVGRAEGADLDDALADEVLDAYRAAPVDSVNSLHADRLAGRRTEVDARNGVVVRLGRRHGIATPCNQLAVALMNVLGPPRTD